MDSKEFQNLDGAAQAVAVRDAFETLIAAHWSPTVFEDAWRHKRGIKTPARWISHPDQS